MYIQLALKKEWESENSAQKQRRSPQQEIQKGKGTIQRNKNSRSTIVGEKSLSEKKMGANCNISKETKELLGILEEKRKINRTKCLGFKGQGRERSKI